MGKKIIQTKVSPAYWKGSINANFPEDPKGKKICWLDVLLGGGLHLPPNPDDKNDKSVPLFVLIAGPPGSGKTTLALEVCYRSVLGTNEACIYTTSEGMANSVREKACSIWHGANHIFNTISKEVDKDHVIINSFQEFQSLLQGDQECESHDRLKGIFHWVFRIAPIIIKLIGQDNKFSDLEPYLPSNASNAATDSVKPMTRTPEVASPSRIPGAKPNFIVFDSLIPTQERFAALESLLKPSLFGPNVLLVIADSSAEIQEMRRWEHRCDVLIHLDRREEKLSDYLVRTIEVVKARYQAHVWGKHQLKIYALRKEEESEQSKESHPYLSDGGIFIYPSIHYCLSRYKRRPSDLPSVAMPTPLASLNQILGGGIPGGRCTAIVGSRGAHKSHLGYYHLLNAIEQFPLPAEAKEYNCGAGEECGLVISLRDDEGMAKEAMLQLLSSMPGYGDRKHAREHYDFLIQDGRLDVQYFRPGYIRPEEFYHRVLMSVLRFKSKGNRLTVLFNSIDQLFARFPLCAREDIFVPGLIDTFLAEGITSIFIAVDEQGQPESQYGLLPMADLIITSNTIDMPGKKYFNCLLDAGQLNITSKQAKLERERLKSKSIRTVRLRVDRFAGGQRAGSQGILELVEKSVLQDFYRNKQALAFAPFIQ